MSNTDLQGDYTPPVDNVAVGGGWITGEPPASESGWFFLLYPNNSLALIQKDEGGFRTIQQAGYSQMGVRAEYYMVASRHPKHNNS